MDLSQQIDTEIKVHDFYKQKVGYYGYDPCPAKIKKNPHGVAEVQHHAKVKSTQPNQKSTNMKKITLLLYFLLMTGVGAFAQILKPVTWSYAAKKTGTNTATIYLKATIDDRWHIYSQFVKDGGPVKTSFSFPKSKGYMLIGKTIEPKPVTKFESTFGMDVSYFEKSVVFQQKIKLTGKTAVVKGTVEFMVCNDKECLPPDEVPFSIAVK